MVKIVRIMTKTLETKVVEHLAVPPPFLDLYNADMKVFIALPEFITLLQIKSI